jgi:hypothetical protein
MARNKITKIITKGKKKKLKIDLKTIKGVAKARMRAKKKAFRKSSR